jgi:hypothetical protein
MFKTFKREIFRILNEKLLNLFYIIDNYINLIMTKIFKLKYIIIKRI